MIAHTVPTPAPHAALRDRLTRAPRAAALTIFAALLAFNTLGGLALRAAFPALGGQGAAFVALLADTAGIVLLLSALGWWGEAGFNRPAAWRRLGLLWLPAALVLVLPFVAGIAAPAPATLAFLAVGHALTGFTEEAIWRGLVFRLLRPRGALGAIWLSATLFGALHLGNLVFRSNPALVFAQIIGAICFGLAYAALRLRTNTIWFLIPLHALHDLGLHLTRLPAIPLNVAQDIVLLAFALVLMRGLRAARAGALAPDDPSPHREEGTR